MLMRRANRRDAARRMMIFIQALNAHCSLEPALFLQYPGCAWDSEWGVGGRWGCAKGCPPGLPV